MRGLGAVLVPVVLAVACSSGHLDPPVPADRLICIDGLAVDGGALTVWDVLTRNVRTRRWLAVAPGMPGPLVLVDDTEVDGIQRLTGIVARDVVAVETLEADRAVPEFGPRAGDGVLLVRTRAASSRVDRRPESRPPERCR